MKPGVVCTETAGPQRREEFATRLWKFLREKILQAEEIEGNSMETGPLRWLSGTGLVQGAEDGGRGENGRASPKKRTVRCQPRLGGMSSISSGQERKGGVRSG